MVVISHLGHGIWNLSQFMLLKQKYHSLGGFNPHSLEAGSTRSRGQQIGVRGFAGGHLLAVSSHAQDREHLSCDSSFEVTNQIHEGSTSCPYYGLHSSPPITIILGVMRT